MEVSHPTLGLARMESAFHWHKINLEYKPEKKKSI